MNLLLSVLIPTLPERQDSLFNLLADLHSQMEKWNIEDKIEIIVDDTDSSLSIGSKRQRLLEKAKGKYIVYVDDDDFLLNDYLHEIVSAINVSSPDVISFRGYMTHDGKRKEIFVIMKDMNYETKVHGKDTVHYRYSNHLCPIKRELALKIGYKNMRRFEDFDYATRLKNSGLLKTEHYIDRDLYYYNYISTKKVQY